MKVLRTAVVGLGRIGWQYHIPHIIRNEGFELTCVCDPLEDRLDEAKMKFSVKGFSDVKQMIESEELDLIVIASPTMFHAEQSILALEHGIDVFLEKPFAQSLEESDRIINAMKKKCCKLMVYQPHRITQEFLALKDIINKGVIGKVYMIKRACSAFIRRNDWQSLRENGGGMLNNYGAHFIDQILYLANSPAKSIFCNMRKIASLGDADDVVKIIVETNNGIIMDLDINMAVAYPLPEWIVMGTNGTVTYKIEVDGKGFFHVRYFISEELDSLDLQVELAANGRNYDNFDRIPWHEEKVDVSDCDEIDFYDKCYDYYALDKEPFVPISETREIMRVISECRKDAGWDKE